MATTTTTAAATAATVASVPREREVSDRIVAPAHRGIRGENELGEVGADIVHMQIGLKLECDCDVIGTLRAPTDVSNIFLRLDFIQRADRSAISETIFNF